MCVHVYFCPQKLGLQVVVSRVLITEPGTSGRAKKHM